MQGAAALAVTGSLARAFPRLPRELLGFAFVSAGYLVVHRAVGFFGQGQRRKGTVWSAAWLIVLATVLVVFMGGHRITPLAAFVGASAFRVLRITRMRLLWLAGVAIPICLAWLTAGPLIYFHGAAAPWYLATVACADLAFSCRILEAITGIFDRYQAAQRSA